MVNKIKSPTSQGLKNLCNKKGLKANTEKSPSSESKKSYAITTHDIVESTRQSFVVMKNEIKKFFSGKRMLVFLGLMGAILFILTFAPYIIGDGLDKDVGKLSYTYLTMSTLIILMGSTLFASICIVSEYEERTALIIFTRPIRKVSIFTGKILASLSVSIGFLALYYIFTAIVSAIVAKGVDPDLAMSFVMGCFYAFGTTGVAVAVSSLMKKSSTATLMTFIVLLAIIPALSIVMSAAGMSNSWMLDQAGTSITNISESYRNITNEMLESIAELLSDPATFLYLDQLYNLLVANGFVGTMEQMIQIVSQCLIGGFDPSVFGGTTAPDVLYNIEVMVVWGLATMVIGFLLFLRREF